MCQVCQKIVKIVQISIASTKEFLKTCQHFSECKMLSKSEMKPKSYQKLYKKVKNCKKIVSQLIIKILLKLQILEL